MNGRTTAYINAQGKVATQLTPAELNTVKAVAAANVKTSIAAENLLSALYGTVYPHPIKKFSSSTGGRYATDLKASNEKQTPISNQLTLYPNPAHTEVNISLSPDGIKGMETKPCFVTLFAADGDEQVALLLSILQLCF